MPPETIEDIIRNLIQQERSEKFAAIRDLHPKADRMMDALMQMYTTPDGVDVESVELAADLVLNNVLEGYRFREHDPDFDPWSTMHFTPQGQILDGRGEPIQRFDPRALRQGTLTPINPLGTFSEPSRSPEVHEASLESGFDSGLPIGKRGSGAIEI